MRSAPSIGFEYRPSRWPQAALVLVAVLALAALFLSALPRPAAWALAGLVAVYMVRACRDAGKHEVSTVTWRVDGGWTLRLVDDHDVEARLLGARTAGSAIVLRLAWEPRGREALILMPDNLDADTRRRLRLRLSAMPDTD